MEEGISCSSCRSIFWLRALPCASQCLSRADADDACYLPLVVGVEELVLTTVICSTVVFPRRLSGRREKT